MVKHWWHTVLGMFCLFIRFIVTLSNILGKCFLFVLSSGNIVLVTIQNSRNTRESSDWFITIKATGRLLIGLNHLLDQGSIWLVHVYHKTREPSGWFIHINHITRESSDWFITITRPGSHLIGINQSLDQEAIWLVHVYHKTREQPDWFIHINHKDRGAIWLVNNNHKTGE